MPEINAFVSVNRFRDCGAVTVLYHNGTVYLDLEGAKALAQAAQDLVRSLEQETFVESTFQQAAIRAYSHMGAVPRKGSD